MAGQAILVVDDNLANVKLLEFLLSSQGYEVRTATDAASALDVLAGFTPNLILMDLQLPDMDGLALTRQLRARPATSGTPIIAVTAYAMKGDEQTALDAGCDGYITKPIDTRTFPATIEEYLRRPRSRATPATPATAEET